MLVEACLSVLYPIVALKEVSLHRSHTSWSSNSIHFLISYTIWFHQLKQCYTRKERGTESYESGMWMPLERKEGTIVAPKDVVTFWKAPKTPRKAGILQQKLNSAPLEFPKGLSNIILSSRWRYKSVNPELQRLKQEIWAWTIQRI